MRFPFVCVVVLVVDTGNCGCVAAGGVAAGGGGGAGDLFIVPLCSASIVIYSSANSR